MVYNPNPWSICPACGSRYLSGEKKCSNCGYDKSPLPSRARYVPSIPHANIPNNYSGTLTITASASRAMINLEAMRQRLEPGEITKEDVEYFSSVIDFSKDVLAKQNEVRTNTNPTHIEQYRQQIMKYRDLVDGNLEEKKYQEFFEKNPNFLVQDQTLCIPKPNYGGEFKPDFMIESSTSLHYIIEIEKPNKPIFRQDRETQPNAEFTQAVSQIGNYLQWVRNNLQFLKERDWPRIRVENMRGLLIIGVKNILNKKQIERLQAINHEVRGTYQVKTFDDLVSENLAALDNLTRVWNI